MKIRTVLILLAFIMASGSPINAQKIVQGNTDFAFDLYQNLSNKQKGDLFFAPFSIHSTLAMVYLGADAETKNQMQKTLHFPVSVQKTAHELDVLTDVIGKQKSIQVANALWIDNSLTLETSFTKLIKKHFKGQLNYTSFKSNYFAKSSINKWVAKNTNNKIKNLIAQPLDTKTKVVLVNAVAFSDKWGSAFDEVLTKAASFHSSTKKSEKVAFMKQRKKYKYFENADFQMVEMPYQGKNTSMLVLLPKKKHNLAAIEKQLTYKNYQAWTKALRKKEVLVKMPKFSMNSELKLPETLEYMGMREPFTSAANFSKLSKQQLRLNALIHKAQINIDESGTRASAATIGTIVPKGARMPTVFHANHPFIFIVRDVETNTVLFMGRKGKTNSKATKAVIIKAAKPTKKIAKKSAKKSTKILASTVSKPKLKPSRTTGKKVMHTVKPGETLYAVSRKYKLKVTLIKEWNKLKTNSLEVGQRLVVGKSEVPVAAGHRVTKPKLKPKAPRAKKRVTKTKSAKMHTVSSGETLYKVSRTYGVSVTKIKTLNKMTSNSLEVGQRLKIQ